MSDNFKGLRKLTENAKKLQGQSQVSLGTLFNEGFIQSNTDFESIDDLFEKAGFNVETPEDFEAIPQERIDQFIREHTKYESFNDLQTKAAAEYFKKQLLKGIK